MMSNKSQIIINQIGGYFILLCLVGAVGAGVYAAFWEDGLAPALVFKAVIGIPIASYFAYKCFKKVHELKEGNW